MTDEAMPLGPRKLTAEEAVEKALLFTFQLSNIDYRKMQAALSEVEFIRALEQDGYTVAALSAPAGLDVEALQDALRDPEVQHFLRYGSFWHAATAIRELVAGTGGLSHDR